MDECDVAERDTLLIWLHDLQEMLPLIICISSRTKTAYSRPDLPQLVNIKSTSIPDLNPDLERFVEIELDRCLGSGKLILLDPAIIPQLRDTLVTESQGSFLSATLRIKYLCTLNSDRAILGSVVDLPQGLEETYSRILQTQIREGSKGHYQRLTLQLIGVALRHLTTDELREALSVIPGDTDWSPNRLPNEIQSVIDSLGGLVVTNQSDSTVHFLHSSVAQTIRNKAKFSNEAVSTIEDAKKAMAGVVVTYLNYRILYTQLRTNVSSRVPAGAIPQEVISSTVGSSNMVQSLALKLLQFGTRPKVNIVSKGRSEAYVTERFHFWAYAKTYWLQHSFFISEDQPRLCKLLSQLVKEKLVDLSRVSEDGHVSLSWAAENGHKAFVKILLHETRVNPNTRNKQGQPALLQAAKYGHETIVKLLLEAGGIDADKKDKQGRTPLSRAAENGYEGIVQLLLNTKRVDADSRDENGRTPLSWAMDYEHKRVIMLLLDEVAERILTHAFTDSGYASTTANHALKDSQEPFSDDARTIYSTISLPEVEKNNYLSSFASDLLEKVQPRSLRKDSLEILSQLLPDLLKAFAFKLGYTADNQRLCDATIFVLKYRR